MRQYFKATNGDKYTYGSKVEGMFDPHRNISHVGIFKGHDKEAERILHKKLPVIKTADGQWYVCESIIRKVNGTWSKTNARNAGTLGIREHPTSPLYVRGARTHDGTEIILSRLMNIIIHNDQYAVIVQGNQRIQVRGLATIRTLKTIRRGWVIHIWIIQNMCYTLSRCVSFCRSSRAKSRSLSISYRARHIWLGLATYSKN